MINFLKEYWEWFIVAAGLAVAGGGGLLLLQFI
jgi:hypothetical protein